MLRKLSVLGFCFTCLFSLTGCESGSTAHARDGVSSKSDAAVSEQAPEAATEENRLKIS